VSCVWSVSRETGTVRGGGRRSGETMERGSGVGGRRGGHGRIGGRNVYCDGCLCLCRDGSICCCGDCCGGGGQGTGNGKSPSQSRVTSGDAAISMTARKMNDVCPNETGIHVGIPWESPSPQDLNLPGLTNPRKS
jgi:hypothetical protein